MTRTFYRTVKTNPPTRDDFLSGREEGRTRPANPKIARLWEGLSVFETLEQARDMARRYPQQGTFIAAVAISDDGRIRYERTRDTPGHHTLWGDPDDILACVLWVVPV